MLLETKLRPPRRPAGLVARPRIGGPLVGRDRPTLTLVSAAAGFGKTTLLTEWLAGATEAGVATAWVSLDRRDSDPSVFWAYVLAAVGQAAPSVGTEALATLQATPAALEGVVGALLNDLAGLGTEVVLVLDDYHVIESIEVHESMLLLVENLPEQVQLVVASRSDPPWPLGRMRARGQLREVRARDLRFRPHEATAYLNEEMDLGLAGTDVDALGSRTEGWIAALQLAAISLQGRDDPSTFIAGFTGDDRFVVDYLVDEVLDRQPDDLRSFLLATSILSRLNGPLCNAVTGRDDARTVLERLDRSNLFLVSLDDRRHWYRYHHLFADVLRARLADEPGRAAALHRRASAWCEANDDPAEAIRHALAADDVEKAAELIELSVQDLRRARQDATLRGYIEALPETVFANRPVLNLARVGSRMVTGNVDGVGALLDQIESAHREGDGAIVHDQVELGRLPAQVAMYRAALALLGGDLDGTATHGQQAAALCAADDHIGRGSAAALIGLARWAAGDLDPAADQYATAIAAFDRAEMYADVLGCSLGLADIQVGQGRLGAADVTLRSALAVDATHGPLRGSADIHIGLAEVHLERDERAEAAEHLSASLELGERLALPQHAHRWRVVDARLRSIDGDHAAALELLRQAERLYDTDYSPPARPVAATIACVQLAAGDLAAAERWAATAAPGIDDEPTYVRQHEHLTLARVLLAAGRTDEATGLLDRLLAAAERDGRDGGAVEAGLLLALAHDAGGHHARALAVLAEALTRADRERHRRVALDLGRPMTALLRSAVRHDRAADHAAALLAGPQPGLVDPLSRRELDVLRLLRTDLTGPEIAAEMIVSLNTVRTHTRSIFSKLGASSRRAAVRRADDLGL